MKKTQTLAYKYKYISQLYRLQLIIAIFKLMFTYTLSSIKCDGAAELTQKNHMSVLSSVLQKVNERDLLFISLNISNLSAFFHFPTGNSTNEQTNRPRGVYKTTRNSQNVFNSIVTSFLANKNQRQRNIFRLNCEIFANFKQDIPTSDDESSSRENVCEQLFNDAQ
jgi:hypothetical protein